MRTGFLSGRSIRNNICLVMDLVDYSHVMSLERFVLFIDVYKASDSVERPFIQNTINCFGFGQKFINLIGMLYNGLHATPLLFIYFGGRAVNN